MAFDAAALSDKLRKLNASAQSVEQLSAWCVFHWRSAKQVATTWASALSAAPDGQKLAFVFLANDVVQNSRKRGPAYTDAFAPLLPGALRHVIKHATGQETVHQLQRLVAVWEERKVFGAGKTCKELKAAVQLGENDVDGQGAAQPQGDAAAEASLKAVAVAHDALRAAQAKGGPVRGARLALVAALREAADAQEALALTEPQREQKEDGAGAGGGDGDAGEEPEYDPADALLVTDHRGTGTSAAAAAAALDAFAHLPPEQREAMAAALAAAAAAAHTVEHRGANTPTSLLHQPSLGAWAVRGSGAPAALDEAGEEEDGSRGQKRAREAEAPGNAEELDLAGHEQ